MAWNWHITVALISICSKIIHLVLFFFLGYKLYFPCTVFASQFVAWDVIANSMTANAVTGVSYVEGLTQRDISYIYENDITRII